MIPSSCSFLFTSQKTELVTNEVDLRVVVIVMFGRLFGEKVTVKKNAEVGDIVINLPDFSGPDVPPILWPLRGTKRVIFAVPLDITCMELKQRIHGKTKIPLNSMALFYMGTILNSDEVNTFSTICFNMTLTIGSTFKSHVSCDL